MSKSSSPHKHHLISAFFVPILIGLTLFLVPAGKHRASHALAQSPPKPEVSVTIWGSQDPVVLRINDDPQGTGPSGSGPVASNVLIYILLEQCDPAALTAELEVWAETYAPATDDQSSIRQQIGTISPLPGQPDYLFSWHPDSAMPSGLYQIVVDGECTGISDNRVQLYDRRDYPLLHGGHFTTAHIFYSDTALYAFDPDPPREPEACIFDATDPRSKALFWIEECLMPIVDEDVLPTELAWELSDLNDYTDILEIYVTYIIRTDPVPPTPAAEGLTHYRPLFSLPRQAWIKIVPSSDLYTVPYDTVWQGLRAVFSHEFFHVVQSSFDVLTLPRRRNLIVEGQAMLAQTVVHEDAEILDDELNDTGYLGNARSFLETELNKPYNDIDAYTFAPYWRFLYEQYRPGQNDVARMAVVRQALEELGEGGLLLWVDPIRSPQLMQQILDETFAREPGTYDEFNESIAAFALANYLLSDESTKPFTMTAISRYNFPIYVGADKYAQPYVDGRGRSPNRYVYYPPQENPENPVLAPSLEIADEINSSFGMDFIEVNIDPFQYETWLRLEFDGRDDSDAWFQVQVVVENDTGSQIELIDVYTMNDGWTEGWNAGDLVFQLSPGLNGNRIGIVVTRHDVADWEGAPTEGPGTGRYKLTLSNPDDVPPKVAIYDGGWYGWMGLRSDSVDEAPGASADFPRESGLARHEWIRYDPAGNVVAPIPAPVPLGTTPGQHDDRPLFSLAPGQQATVVVTATDKAGNQGHDQAQGTGGSSLQNWPPGNDHPDDNDSAASGAPLAQATVGLWPPAGARPVPAVALFAPGFSFDAEAFLHLAGEPVTRVTSDFSPAIAGRYPVLVIPSGGLYGFQGSPLLRARLEAYAEAGGTLLVFAQQRGEDYAVLPGGQVGGYGWRQDTSCFDASLLLETYHPALSGFDSTHLTAHVDGYFTQYPEDSTVLLSRSQNGMPGALMYPYGQGRVIVTSIYDDWGAARGQPSADARTFVRDLLSWAVEPADGLPTYAPGQPVSLSVPAANDTRREVTAVRLSLVSPAREIVAQQVITASLAPGAAASLPFTTTAATPLGVWRLDATLLAAEGQAVAPRTPAARFIVSSPPQALAPTNPLALSITAPDSHVPMGSLASFTYNIYNHDDQPVTATVSYAINHEAYSVFAADVPVPGAQGGTPGMATVPFELYVPYKHSIFRDAHTFRLRGHVAAGGYEAYSSFGVTPVWSAASPRVSLSCDPCRRGETVLAGAFLPNPQRATFTGTVQLTAFEAAATPFFTATLPFSLTASMSSWNGQAEFQVPADAEAGMRYVRIEGFGAEGQSLGGRQDTFHVPDSPLVSRLDLNGGIIPASAQTIPLVITNTSSVLDVSQGVATLTLQAAGGAPMASGEATFSLSPGQAAAVPVPMTVPALSYADERYRLAVQLADEHGRQSWGAWFPLTATTSAVLDQASYQVRQTAAATLTLANPGPFVQDIGLDVAVPGLGFDEAHSITLPPYGEMQQLYHIPVPADAPPGLHTLAVTASLGAGNTFTGAPAAIYVPESELQAVVSELPVSGGQTLTVSVRNSGGVDTSVDYRLAVYDARGLAIADADGAAVSLPASQVVTIPLTLPLQIRSGKYTLSGTATERASGHSVSVYRALDLAGLATELSAFTGASAYLTTDSITVTAVITNQEAPLANGQLEMRITYPGQWTSATTWLTYTTSSSGLGHDRVIDVAVDGLNNKWFLHRLSLSVLSADRGQWQTLSGPETTYYWTLAISGPDSGVKWIGTDSGAWVLDDNGTPFDDADDTWLELQDGGSLCVEGEPVDDIVTDASGRVWFATNGNGLCVLDYGGTPLNLADDQWAQFTTDEGGNGPSTNYLDWLAVDAGGQVWVASWYGLDVLNYGDDPFDGAGDVWGQLTIPGLAEGGLSALAIDSSGIKWVGTFYDGLFALDDGGTPFDDADDTWTQYTSQTSGLVQDGVQAIAIDREGNLWIGTWGGLSILTPGSVWHNYTPLDGLGSGNINAIAVDADGNRWLATSYDDGPYDGEYVDLPGGVTAAIGPGFPPGFPWTVFTADNSGLAENSLSALAADQDGNLWVAGSDSGGTERLMPGSGIGLASPLEQRYAPFLNRLSPGGNWTTFYPPHYDYFNQADVAADAVGDIWLAVDGNYGGGLYVFSAGSETWDDTRRPPGLYGPPTALVAEGDNVWVAFDYVWDEGFYPEGIAAYSLDQSAWTLLYQGSQDPYDQHVYFRDAAVDPAGDIWFATNGGVWRLLADHTTWITYTTQNSPLVSDYVEAVMVDGQGHRWFATDHGTSVFAAGEGQWADFSASASSLAVDSQGRVWFADYSGGARVLDYGASPFDPGDDEWTIYNGDRDLGNKYVEDILVDGQGDVWFATNYSGLVRYDTPASPIGPILWEHSAILSAASGGTAQEAAGLTSAELGVTGKLYLEADLNAESGQALAAARYPFYIFGTDTGLTLEADRSVYRPGQIMTLSGQALNGASLPLTGQTLTVWVDNQVVYTETDVSVPAGGSYPFSVSTSVPQEDGEVTLRASLQDVRIEDVVRVSSPALAAFLEAPAVVGRNPFNLRLTLDNPTLLDLSVTATLDGDAQTVDIPPGETQVVSYTAQITGDTLFSLQISGDVTDTLTRSIQMGESAAIVFAPQPLYPPGRAAVPYTVTNTGLLPTTFPLSVTLHAGMDLVQTETLSIALPAGDSASGLLMFDVAEGDYLLGFSSPFEAGSLSWRVVPFDQVSLGVEARPPVETEIPLDVTITNTGVNTFAGHLALDATFFSQQLPIDLDVGQVLTSVVSVDTTYAAPGTHPVTLTVLADNGALLATQVVSISAAPPSFVLVSPPVSATLVAGDVATLTFEVENTGGTRGEARFNLNFSDIGDNSQWLSLAPGETGRFDFSFTVPAELVTRDYVATYVLSNTVTGETLENDLTLTVSGLELDVSATLDQAVYASGQTASLTLDIVNLSPSATGDLYAVVRYGSFEDSQSFSLAGSGTRSLTFAVPVDFEAGDTIFYGVYDQASNRGVHLNTIHIYPLNPSATLTTDRQVYQPGQTVQATVATSATGTLLVQAPGYSQTLTVTGSDANFSFTLPSPMAEGSYEIRYTLVDCACEDEGQPYLYRFDVAGIQMSVVQAALERDTYASGDTIRLNLIVASHQALPASLRTYVIYPDGSQSQPLDRPVRLEAIENNHLVAELPFVTSMVGPHALVYGLLDPDDEELWYAAGAAGFDVGAVMLAGLTTDKDVYAYTDEVVNLQVQAFGVATSTGTLDLKLDGVSVQSQPLTSGEGIQSFDMPLAVPVTPGFHRLSAVLESGDGPSQSTTYFTYGTQAADLQASALWPAGAADSITRTLNVLVANQGGEPAPASLLAFYDGDPAGDGVLIGQAPVSDLDVDAETQTQIVWNIRGQGGAHLLYTMADSENDVAEFRENNNVRQTSVTLPRFILRAVALEETYELGEVLTPSVRLENLLGDTSLAGTLTTTISFIGEDLYYDVISQTHVLMLAPEETEDVSLTWDTAQLSSGLYRIEHTFVDDTGEERSAESLIELIEPTRAYFLAAPRSGAVPLIVNFSDRSTGRIITRTWNFGDGITQTITSTTFLSHTYTLASVYTASLTVVDVDSVTDTTSLTITATTPISLVAAFNAEPLRGIVPFTVTFVDESVGQVLTRTWSFGDGSSPVNTSAMTIDHRYEIPGVYSVTLAVYNSAGSDVITQSNYILAVSPQTSGTVTLDAENYARQVSGPGPAWETRTTYPGYAGDGYVQALPDVDVLFDTDLIGAGSALQYDLGLTVTGTYTIWLRGYAANAAGDSVYVGLNGQPITSTDYVSAFPPARRPAVAGTWAWANTWAGSGQPITFTIETPGVHTLDIWVREDGFSLDQIILTTEENFNPGG